MPSCDCVIHAMQDGGCFYLKSRMELNLTRATLENCEAPMGSVLYTLSSVGDGDGPLTIATMVTVWQRNCQAPLFVQHGVAQLVLRMVTFMPLSGCNTTALNSPTAFGNVSTKGCGEVYSSLNAFVFGMCSSDAADACKEWPIAGTPLTGLACTCPSPQLVNPALGNATLAPYVRTGGCIVPRELERMYVQRDEVVVALSKPNNTLEVVNVTLTMKGDDWERPARWSVQNAPAMSANSPWLQLPVVDGNVSGAEQLSFALRLSASGLRESSTPYVETLQITVRSVIAAATRTQSLLISLSVQARTSFIAWGRVCTNGTFAQPLALGEGLATIAMPLLDGTVVDVVRRVPFIACDHDRLPVRHQLPSLSDQRSLRAFLHEFGGTSDVTIEYTGGGGYDALLTVSWYGPFNLSLRLDAENVFLSGRAVCASNREAIPGRGSCGCTAGTFESTTRTCEPCPLRTSSVKGSVGEVACSFCDVGSYRPAEDEGCRPCPDEARCPLNATLPTLLLRDGYWRLAPSSRQILPCANMSDTSCLGGGHIGQCADGYKGPRCAVCADSRQHHDDVKGCIVCPDATRPTLLAVAVLAGAAMLALGVWRLYICPPARLRGCSLRLHSAVETLHAFGWGAKLRIAFSWYQCITVLDTLYGVTLPKTYTDWVEVFDFIDVDWMGWLLPASCVGSFQRRMLFSALAPLVLVCLLVGWRVVRRGGSSPYAASLSALGPSLLVVFLLAPSINRKVFQTWDCEPYEFSETEDHHYMRASLSVRCYSAEHTALFPTSFVLLAIWPVGSLALFAGLVLRGRRRLLDHSPDQFIRDIRFLHDDFKVSRSELAQTWQTHTPLTAPPFVTARVLLLGDGRARAALHPDRVADAHPRR